MMEEVPDLESEKSVPVEEDEISIVKVAEQ
jgi:hypothetical protein